MTEENAFEFQIHYHLKQEDLHQMDARVFNECERQLLDAFDIVKAITGGYNIEIAPKKKGGLVEILVIPAITIIGYETIKNLFTALIQKFFSSTQTKLTNTKDRIEILEKIKSRNLTKEEAEILVDDPKIKKCVSNFFKSIDKENNVTNIDASAKAKGETEPFSSAQIVKVDFTKKILVDTILENKKEIVGTTIRILSPVLQQGHGKVWRGYYSAKPIDFKVLDKEFLKQVYNNEIKFGTNTVITCTLIISTKQKIENGEENDIKTEYAVKDVLKWEDDDTFQNYTKRYKKIKDDERQLNLFNPPKRKGE